MSPASQFLPSCPHQSPLPCPLQITLFSYVCCPPLSCCPYHTISFFSAFASLKHALVLQAQCTQSFICHIAYSAIWHLSLASPKNYGFVRGLYIVLATSPSRHLLLITTHLGDSHPRFGGSTNQCASSSSGSPNMTLDHARTHLTSPHFSWKLPHIMGL